MPLFAWCVRMFVRPCISSPLSNPYTPRARACIISGTFSPLLIFIKYLHTFSPLYLHLLYLRLAFRHPRFQRESICVRFWIVDFGLVYPNAAPNRFVLFNGRKKLRLHSFRSIIKSPNEAVLRASPFNTSGHCLLLVFIQALSQARKYQAASDLSVSLSLYGRAPVHAPACYHQGIITGIFLRCK